MVKSSIVKMSSKRTSCASVLLTFFALFKTSGNKLRAAVITRLRSIAAPLPAVLYSGEKVIVNLPYEEYGLVSILS